jgi:hypothetical protein
LFIPNNTRQPHEKCHPLPIAKGEPILYFSLPCVVNRLPSRCVERAETIRRRISNAMCHDVTGDCSARLRDSASTRPNRASHVTSQEDDDIELN